MKYDLKRAYEKLGVDLRPYTDSIADNGLGDEDGESAAYSLDTDAIYADDYAFTRKPWIALHELMHWTEPRLKGFAQLPPSPAAEVLADDAAIKLAKDFDIPTTALKENRRDWLRSCWECTGDFISKRSNAIVKYIKSRLSDS